MTLLTQKTSLQEVQSQIAESVAVKQRMAAEQSEILCQISEMLIYSLQNGGTLYLCGNGGSAADAQHVAAEFVGRYLRERRALPAVALTTNTSALTALGNDYDYATVFSRQIQAFVSSKDVVIGITTSGKSPNIIEAVRVAHECGATTIGFTGLPGRPLYDETDLCLCVPSKHTPRIQEAHILAWHIICDLVEQKFVG